jgi:hypothetical protein
MEPILKRRLPMTFAASVPARLRQGIDTAIGRMPWGIQCCLKGRPSPYGCREGWRIELLRELPPDPVRGTIFGHCIPPDSLIRFAGVALALPEEQLVCLSAHELMHAALYDMDRTGLWKWEEEVNTRLWKFGFNVEALCVEARRAADAERRNRNMAAA